MDQEGRRVYLIDYLLKESGADYTVPKETEAQKRLLRSLLNVRPPKSASAEFLKVQDEYLKEEIARKGITDVKDLNFKGDFAVWRGDITTLRVDAIVNAANSELLGCFQPLHYCIDNAIHTFSGVHLRQKCYEIMLEQGHAERTGAAKITKAYNLPSEYILHTVGPIVNGKITTKDEKELASCYRSCLELAREYKLKSIAFCCISTGVFGFPQRPAAEVALNAVKRFKEDCGSNIKVVFNVFTEKDSEIYNEMVYGE